MHFFIQRAGEKSECVAHGDDGTAHCEAVEIIAAGEIEPRRDGEEGFARSRLSETGHQ